ncbi:MAG: response regulator, partial [Lachnospiraceae bacterium]|nr:response regulator [Lachnospiraceae bacterium]
RVEGEKNLIRLRVSVEDTGVGIKHEDIDKLFVKFERVDEERYRNVEGTGLGLSIAKRLLEMMDSELEVESEFGHGSRFSFVITQPVVKWDALGDYEVNYSEWLANRKRYKEKFTAPRARVLMVDDNQMNLTVFKGLLKKTQVKTDLAMSGDEGLRKAAEKRYDIIFLDHMMPGKDGIQTLHELKAMKDGPNRNTPVICLTANAISGARDYYLSEGFDDYLSKPVDHSKLEDMLIEHLPDDAVMPEGSIFAYEIQKTKPYEDGIEEIPEAVAAIEAIDAKEGLKNSGSVEAYMSLIRIFYNDMDRNITQLCTLYDEERIQEYTVCVHAMKSSAWLIGAFQLGEDARMLEEAGKKSDMAYLRSHHDLYIGELGKFRETLSEIFRESDESGEKPMADSELIATKYEMMKAAAEAMDCDVLDEIFEELAGYRIQGDDAEKIDSLKKLYDKFDYEGILRML